MWQKEVVLYQVSQPVTLTSSVSPCGPLRAVKHIQPTNVGQSLEAVTTDYVVIVDYHFCRPQPPQILAQVVYRNEFNPYSAILLESLTG